MTKNAALKILNPVLGVLLINQMLTGIFADQILARAPDAFEVLHEGNGYLIVFLSVVHVILNWPWVKANFCRKPTASRA